MTLNALKNLQQDFAVFDYREVTVIIPTLNENSNISDLLSELISSYQGIKVAVVDDGSSDGTQESVLSMATLTKSDISLIDRKSAAVHGLTASVVQGLFSVSTEYFVVMDGDLQHPPRVIPDLLESLLKGADLAIGVRLPYHENQGLHRIVFTRFATWIAKRHLLRRELSLADPMSGLFAGRSELVKKLLMINSDRFQLAGYKVLFDLLRTSPVQLKVSEVPYQFGLRNTGHSKLRFSHAVSFLRSLWS